MLLALTHSPPLTRRPAAEQVLADYIFPLPSASSASTGTGTGGTSKGAGPEVDDGAWADRLLLVMRHLDERGIKHLLVTTSGLKIRCARRP
jgi:sister-chromatid-cohesion protein PDS5